MNWWQEKSHSNILLHPIVVTACSGNNISQDAQLSYVLLGSSRGREPLENLVIPEI